MLLTGRNLTKHYGPRLLFSGITMGFSEDLDEAAEMATREMVAYIVDTYKLTPADAYVLASGVVDLHVTQNVDEVKGIHASLPKNIFKK